MNLLQHLRVGRSRLLALTVGALMYASYAYGRNAWGNVALICVSGFVAAALPRYSLLSGKAEEAANKMTALVTAGRLARLALQLGFNLAVFSAFMHGGLIPAPDIDAIGGIAGAALCTTLLSQGSQYLAITMFNRGLGDLNRNVMLALSANVVFTAAATLGIPFVNAVFTLSAALLGGGVFALGVASDLRGRFFPKGGVGIFFGTFNPFHVTHLELIRNAIATRKLSKVIVHPTVVPKLHATALARGEIAVSRNEAGMCVLAKTAKADPHVNYFPTGSKFYLPETRKLMIELAIEEAGLADKVTVMWEPDTYRDKGFHGVVAAIRKAHPGVRLHGLHGSDLGGMWVRSIYDECGIIYPMPVVRRDQVSATAIRNGAVGMTSEAVDAVIAGLKRGLQSITVRGKLIINESTLLAVPDVSRGARLGMEVG